MNVLTMRRAASAETDALVHILHDAEEGDARIRALLETEALDSYAVWENGELVGAAVVRWSEESEIQLLAVSPSRRRQGIGKRIIAALLEEARRQSARVLLVGTASLSLDNIVFYQKCGFRMSRIRRDYFDYIQPPLILEGVTLRDMIIFDYVLEGETHET